MTNEAQQREMGEKYAIAAADMIRRGLPLDVCARKLIAAVCVIGMEKAVFTPVHHLLCDIESQVSKLRKEFAETRDDQLSMFMAELAKYKEASEQAAPSVATAPPVDVPCARCGVGQRKHRSAAGIFDGECAEWRAGNL